MSMGEAHEHSIAPGCDSASLVDVVLSASAGRFGLDEGLEWGCLDNAGLRSAAVEVQKAIGALQHQQRRILALIDERKAYAAVGSRDAADWAAGQLGVSRKTASDDLDIARSSRRWPTPRRRVS